MFDPYDYDPDDLELASDAGYEDDEIYEDDYDDWFDLEDDERIDREAEAGII